MYIIASLLCAVWVFVCTAGCIKQWKLNARIKQLEAEKMNSSSRADIIAPCDDVLYASGIPVYHQKSE